MCLLWFYKQFQQSISILSKIENKLYLGLTFDWQLEACLYYIVFVWLIDMTPPLISWPPVTLNPEQVYELLYTYLAYFKTS